MGIAKVGQVFSGYLEITGMGLLRKYDSASGLAEAKDVLVFLVAGWAIWGNGWEMETEVQKRISSESSVEKAEQTSGKLPMIVSHCSEYSVV